MTAPTRDDVLAFGTVIERALGLRVEPDAHRRLEVTLGERLARTRDRDAAAYFDRVMADRREQGELARRLTVTETYFFRDPAQLRVFGDWLATRGDTPAHILSAACSSGEELYSLAILAREILGIERARAHTFTGIDLDPHMLERARAGRYTSWSLRQTPSELSDRYFRTDGKQVVVDDSLRRAVSFEQRNLAGADLGFWATARFDVIFCRNVLMYFTPAAMQAAVARLAGALAPGGLLFVGHAESLRGITAELSLEHDHETFYYRKHGGQRAVAAPHPVPALETEPTAPVASSPCGAPPGWYDEISESTQRVAELSRRVAEPSAAAPVDVLATVWELLRTERHAEALEEVERIAATTPEAKLVRASLLVGHVDTPAAESACRELVEAGDADPGAHYLLALCRERAGDLAEARYHDHAALALDPRFAMAHLHLALLARRLGDQATAGRELRLALATLEREEPRRILLFGGGFDRHALMQMCRLQLDAIGDAR